MSRLPFSLPPQWVLSNLSSACSLLSSEHLWCITRHLTATPYPPWIPPRGPTPISTKIVLMYSFFWRNLEKEIKIFDFSCMHAVLSRTIFFSIIKDGNFIRCYPDGWKEENVGAHMCILTSRGISFLEELFLWQFNNSAESVPNAYECSSTNGEAPKFRMEFLIVPGWEYWLRDSSGKSKTINSSFPPKKKLCVSIIGMRAFSL